MSIHLLDCKKEKFIVIYMYMHVLYNNIECTCVHIYYLEVGGGLESICSEAGKPSSPKLTHIS